MPDKVKLIKKEIERRTNLLKNGEADLEVMKRVEGVLLAYNSILEFIDSLQEEPVSEDLEEEVDIEDAVHGVVDFPFIGHDFPNIYPNYKELKEYCNRKGIKDNDKVKIIIVKEEQQ